MGRLVCTLIRNAVNTDRSLGGEHVDGCILMGGNIRGGADYSDESFFSLETLEAEVKPEEVLCGVLLDVTSRRWRTSCTKLHDPHAIAARLATHRSSASSRCPVGCSRRACGRRTAAILYLAGFSLCGNDSSSHFSAMTLPCWLRRAVRTRHCHAIEQASRRWRGG